MQLGSRSLASEIFYQQVCHSVLRGCASPGLSAQTVVGLFFSFTWTLQISIPALSFHSLETQQSH